MEQLITIENSTAVLSPKVAEEILFCERVAKEAKAREDELKAKILEEMESRNIIKIEHPNLSITYVAEFDRESFDTKAFKKAEPDLYDSYVKMTTVKPSIRIKVE